MNSQLILDIIDWINSGKEVKGVMIIEEV